MKYPITLSCCLLCSVVGMSAAQEPSGRADLDLLSASPLTQLVIARISFVDSNLPCPEHLGTLRITGGNLRFFRVLPPRTDDPLQPSWSWTKMAIDDETVHNQIANPYSRFDIDLRQQVRRDGLWTSLLVPREMRPSVPAEERHELTRQREESFRKEPTPAQKEMAERWTAASSAVRAPGSPVVSPPHSTLGVASKTRYRLALKP